MTATTHIRRTLALAALALAALAPSAHAGLLAPKAIDAATGKDSVEVGGAIGNHRAWAGFVQETGGVKRLYVDFARNGTWAQPFLADRGNAIEVAGLAGNGRGDAVAVFSEKLNGKDVLFGGRLQDGAAGQIQQISADGEDARFEPLLFHFSRGNKLAMDDAAAATVCYHDAANAKDIIATLAPGGGQWVEHEAGNACSDLVMDSRGNAVSVTVVGNDFDATRLVGGQVKKDKLTDTGMDHPTIAVTPSGLAIAVVRDKNFQLVAFRKRDITQDTPWESLGRVDSDTVFNAGDSPEEPRLTLDANGDGVIVWRSNSANDPRTAFTPIIAGQPMTATFLSSEAANSFPYVTTLSTGVPIAGFELKDTGTTVFPFGAGARRPGLTAAPGMAETSLESAAGLVSDGVGDLLTLLFQGSAPQRTVAVLGDFAPPTVKPSVSPRKVRAKRAVTLRSRAADTFAALGKAGVRWTLPRGVKALHGKRGRTIRVRFAKARRYTISVMATDRGGNRTTAKLRVKVRR